MIERKICGTEYFYGFRDGVGLKRDCVLGRGVVLGRGRGPLSLCFCSGHRCMQTVLQRVKVLLLTDAFPVFLPGALKTICGGRESCSV